MVVRNPGRKPARVNIRVRDPSKPGGRLNFARRFKPTPFADPAQLVMNGRELHFGWRINRHSKTNPLRAQLAAFEARVKGGLGVRQTDDISFIKDAKGHYYAVVESPRAGGWKTGEQTFRLKVPAVIKDLKALDRKLLPAFKPRNLEVSG